GFFSDETQPTRGCACFRQTTESKLSGLECETDWCGQSHDLQGPRVVGQERQLNPAALRKKENRCENLDPEGVLAAVAFEKLLEKLLCAFNCADGERLSVPTNPGTFRCRRHD